MAGSRDEEGKFSTRNHAEEALEAFIDRDDQAKPLTAADVAEYVEWSERTVYNKLDELDKKGVLESRKAGPGKVWWAPLPKDAAPLSVMGLRPQELPQTPEEVIEIVGDSLPARTEEDRQERAKAVLTAYQYLQREGRASEKEIREYTYDEHPIVEETKTHDPPMRLWTLFLRDTLGELPGVDPPARKGIWNFIPPGGELEAELNCEIDEWIVEEVDIQGSGDQADHQRALLQMAYDHLKEQGEAKRDDFKQALPENYTAHYSGFEGVWMYLLSDNLKEAPGVEYEKGQSANIYRYTGDE